MIVWNQKIMILTDSISVEKRFITREFKGYSFIDFT